MRIGGNVVQQEGNVLQEPAAAMNLMFPLKIWTMLPWNQFPGRKCFQNFIFFGHYLKLPSGVLGTLIQYDHFATIIISCLLIIYQQWLSAAPDTLGAI